MLFVGAMMLKRRDGEGYAGVRLGPENFFKLAALGLASGALAGFFGVGGGFLIVPGLMLASNMPILNAIGSSLVSVTAFSVATASNYAFSGLVDWTAALSLLGGGVAGSLVGGAAARRLSTRRGALNIIFALLVIAVAIYVLARSGAVLM